MLDLRCESTAHRIKSALASQDLYLYWPGQTARSVAIYCLRPGWGCCCVRVDRWTRARARVQGDRKQGSRATARVQGDRKGRPYYTRIGLSPPCQCAYL